MDYDEILPAPLQLVADNDSISNVDIIPEEEETFDLFAPNDSNDKENDNDIVEEERLKRSYSYFAKVNNDDIQPAHKDYGGKR